MVLFDCFCFLCFDRSFHSYIPVNNNAGTIKALQKEEKLVINSNCSKILFNNLAKNRNIQLNYIKNHESLSINDKFIFCDELDSKMWFQTQHVIEMISTYDYDLLEQLKPIINKDSYPLYSFDYHYIIYVDSYSYYEQIQSEISSIMYISINAPL